MVQKIIYPCPCGGKLEWKKERVIKDGVDCGLLDVEYCQKCGEEYLPDESLEIVEDKLRKLGLWGMERRQIKFWKTGKAITIRFPVDFVKKLHLNDLKKGYIYQEGKHKIAIEF